MLVGPFCYLKGENENRKGEKRGMKERTMNKIQSNENDTENQKIIINVSSPNNYNIKKLNNSSIAVPLPAGKHHTLTQYYQLY